jgi:hypothetical protein
VIALMGRVVLWRDGRSRVSNDEAGCWKAWEVWGGHRALPRHLPPWPAIRVTRVTERRVIVDVHNRATHGRAEIELGSSCGIEAGRLWDAIAEAAGFLAYAALQRLGGWAGLRRSDLGFP